MPLDSTTGGSSTLSQRAARHGGSAASRARGSSTIAPPAPGSQTTGQRRSSNPNRSGNTSGNPARNVGPFQSVGNLGSRNARFRQPQGLADRARALLGPLGQLYEGQLTRQDAPLFEAGLNMQQILQTLEDRDRAYGLLQGARDSVGQSRASTMARELGISRAQEPGPFSEEQLDSQRTAITEQGALGFQDSREQALAELATRGSGGATAAFQLARLQQAAAAQTQQQQSGFELAVAQAREEAQRQNLAQLYGISSEEEERGLNLQTLMAQLLAETERAPIDLSGLIASPPGAGYIVGQQPY